MDVDLRIPLTAEQKRLIAKAAMAEQSDIASWVRPILLKAATIQLRTSETRKQGR